MIGKIEDWVLQILVWQFPVVQLDISAIVARPPRRGIPIKALTNPLRLIEIEHVGRFDPSLLDLSLQRGEIRWSLHPISRRNRTIQRLQRLGCTRWIRAIPATQDGFQRRILSHNTLK